MLGDGGGAGGRHQPVGDEPRPRPPQNGAADLEDYLRYPHVVVSPGGQGGGAVAAALARLGRERRIAVRVRSFLLAPLLLAGTHHLLTLPERAARRVAGEGRELALAEVPLELAPFKLSMVWHARSHQDPGHRWLRGRLAALTEAPDPRGSPPRTP